VHIALAAPTATSARRFVFGGDRQAIRARSVTFALDLLRRALVGEAA
jgi:nicotinamide mononucleotide (NMN) deamidase PncC